MNTSTAFSAAERLLKSADSLDFALAQGKKSNNERKSHTSTKTNKTNKKTRALKLKNYS